MSDVNDYLGLGVVTLDRIVPTLDGRHTREIYGHVVQRQVDVPGKRPGRPMLYVFRRRPPELARPTQEARFVISAEKMVRFLPGLPANFAGFNAQRFTKQGNHGARKTKEPEPCERSR